MAESRRTSEGYSLMMRITIVITIVSNPYQGSPKPSNPKFVLKHFSLLTTHPKSWRMLDSLISDKPTVT